MTTNVVTLWYRAPELLLGATTYDTAIDMWSVGCVVAELLLTKPVFAGKSEIEQISEIFKVLGVPDEGRWPGYGAMPNVSALGFRGKKRNRLRDKFPVAGFGSTTTTPLTNEGFALLDGLFAYDPRRRLVAGAACGHAYFSAPPVATPRHLMPKFGPGSADVGNVAAARPDQWPASPDAPAGGAPPD